MTEASHNKRVLSFCAGEEVFYVGDIVEVEAEGEEVRHTFVIYATLNQPPASFSSQKPFVAEILSKSKKRKNYGSVVRVRWFYRKDGMTGSAMSCLYTRYFLPRRGAWRAS
jgi:hypothetical protein